ncbi:unnamed protein product [Ixodes persulcatus]
MVLRKKLFLKMLLLPRVFHSLREPYHSTTTKLSCQGKVKCLSFLRNIIHNKNGLRFGDYLRYNLSRDTRQKHDKLFKFSRGKYVRKYSFFPREWNVLHHSMAAIGTLSASSASAVDDLFYVKD